MVDGCSGNGLRHDWVHWDLLLGIERRILWSVVAQEDHGALLEGAVLSARLKAGVVVDLGDVSRAKLAVVRHGSN